MLIVHVQLFFLNFGFSEAWWFYICLWVMFSIAHLGTMNVLYINWHFRCWSQRRADVLPTAVGRPRFSYVPAKAEWRIVIVERHPTARSIADTTWAMLNTLILRKGNEWCVRVKFFFSQNFQNLETLDVLIRFLLKFINFRFFRKIWKFEDVWNNWDVWKFWKMMKNQIWASLIAFFDWF